MKPHLFDKKGCEPHLFEGKGCAMSDRFPTEREALHAEIERLRAEIARQLAEFDGAMKYRDGKAKLAAIAEAEAEQAAKEKETP